MNNTLLKEEETSSLHQAFQPKALSSLKALIYVVLKGAVRLILSHQLSLLSYL